MCIVPVFLLIVSVLLPSPFHAQPTSARRNILIISEFGESHRGVAMINQELIEGLTRNSESQIEFYIESLDTTTVLKEESQREIRDWIIRRYRDEKLDAIVAVGPTPIMFLTNGDPPPFPGVPVVICAGYLGAAPPPPLDARFTGTWLRIDPKKTIDVALRLLPETRQLAIVAGSSEFDKARLAQVREGLKEYEGKLDFIDLTGLPMNELLGKLRQLPKNTIVLYVCFFRDAVGQLYVNATTALPMVAEAAKAPVFGMADSYIGHGIVGGNIMSFAEQGRIATRIVSEVLAGKKPSEIPITVTPGIYMFDLRELRRWHIKESSLPVGSLVYFREPSYWERTSGIWILSLSTILGLSVLVVYLQHALKQLRLAKERQKHLTGMLINAGEKERSRVASELHDDFSQRLAVIALKLENVAETISPLSQQAARQLHELLNSTGELGADLHTLSHRLHSSTLGSLGLVPAISALCKEFTSQQGVQVTFKPDGVPHGIPSDAALCVFRVVQEALRNVKKHSGVQECLVTLRIASGRLIVNVIDQGRGFDEKELPQREGVGLRSMEERVSLLSGEFKIESRPGLGTLVEARIPLGKSKSGDPGNSG
jgi:signal transduction histidine kinase